MKGKFCNKIASILIDPSSIYSYIIPQLVDYYNLVKETDAKVWLVQLAIGTKKRISQWGKSSSF